MSVTGRWVVEKWIAAMLWFVCGAAVAHAAGAPGVDRAESDSSTWAISEANIFPAGTVPLRPEIELLLLKLGKKGADGSPVSRKEFSALLARPEAALVYKAGIMRYATPQSVEVQAQAHIDLSKRLMAEESQRACVDFMKQQQKVLRRAEQRYHVSQQDIVGILMWESGLGKYTGKYRIFNVYLGQLLYLDSAQQLAVARILRQGGTDPLSDSIVLRRETRRLARRKLDAVSSLTALLRYAKKMKYDPLTVEGSWGGATGYVQFMPYNMKYAVDADGNGLDLKTWPDAVFSVANFLRHQGKYKPDEAGRRRAILHYNRSTEYADGVIALADTIWQRYQNTK